MKLGRTLIIVGLVAFGLTQVTQAQCPQICDLNTAVGDSALGGGTSGEYKLAAGFEALFDNDTASFNTGAGAYALGLNREGNSNTAIGYASLFSNTGGSNIALGDSVGFNLTTGKNSLASSLSRWQKLILTL